MQHKIIIEKGGQVTHDVVGGQGTNCQKKSAPYIGAIKKQFGLADSEVAETPKPEMQQLNTETDTLEGDKLV